MTQSNRMLSLILLPALLGGAVTSQAQAPAADEDFHVYTDPPRIFLTARRLKLLRRERDRDSMRWQHFQALMAGKAAMPEPGFANALYYQVKGDATYARSAAEWALGAGADLRQQAIVFDWCLPALTPAQSMALAERLQQGIGQAAGKNDVSAVSARTLAAVALSDRKPELAEQVIRQTVVEWWRGYVVPSIQRGEPVIRRDDVLPLYELLHALRDNVNMDVRDLAPKFFQELPSFLLLTYYPPPFPAPENEYRIPVYHENTDPDLRRSSLARAGEFAMVAFDTNALESQFLQGWLLQDRFLMQSPLGAPYEMLWANPYQPGLSYFHLPMVFHDPKRRGGGIAMRSSWEDDAVLFTYFEGKAQVFEDGKRKTVNLAKLEKPFRVADAVVTGQLAFEAEAPVYFVVGLKPGGSYDVEVDDEEMWEEQADAGGILLLKMSPGNPTAVRIHERGRVPMTASAP
jgi:hypothetical protein